MWYQFTYATPLGTRPYFVYVPTNYRLSMKVPLLMMLHGCTQTAADFAVGTAMNVLAEQYTFIVVYPQQTRDFNSGLCWNWFIPSNQVRESGEAAILAGIAQTIIRDTSNWTIDPQRVYVAGLSAGGAMATVLGATYPDLFAAIGVHSGMEFRAANDARSALRASSYGGPDPLQQGTLAFNAMGRYARLLPTIVFHGTEDTVVVPINGDQVVQQWMQTDALASRGAYIVRLDEPTHVTSGYIAGGRSYLTATWSLPNGEEVQAYWKVAGMGHAWSGGNAEGSFTDPLGPSASLAMYHFFLAHPLPAPGAHG